MLKILIKGHQAEAVAASGWPPKKQVINGKAYNTQTATLIHEHIDNDDAHPRHPFGMAQFPYAEQLFRTRFGKFFLVLRNESYWNPAIDDSDLQDRIVPLKPEQAIKWIEEYCNEKISDYIDVPEAGEPSTATHVATRQGIKDPPQRSGGQEGSLDESMVCSGT